MHCLRDGRASSSCQHRRSGYRVVTAVDGALVMRQAPAKPPPRITLLNPYPIHGRGNRDRGRCRRLPRLTACLWLAEKLPRSSILVHCGSAQLSYLMSRYMVRLLPECPSAPTLLSCVGHELHWGGGCICSSIGEGQQEDVTLV